MDEKLISERGINIQVYELPSGNAKVESSFLDPYHLIQMYLEVKPEERKIVQANVQFVNYPHKECPNISSKVKSLEGLVIEKGILKKISKNIGGSEGCVHLRELAINAINFTATSLLGYNQGFGIMGEKFNKQSGNKKYDQSKDVLAGTCHIFPKKE